MDAGVTSVVTSLQVGQAGQWWFDVWAVRTDVAMASTVEAPFLKIYGDDGARAIAHMGTSVFIIQDISLCLDNMVNSVSPNVRGVTAVYFIAGLNTFGSLGILILEWPQCTGNIRGSWLLAVDVDMDVQGRLGDISLEGACKAGVEGVDLGVFGQEVSRDDVGMG